LTIRHPEYLIKLLKRLSNRELASLSAYLRFEEFDKQGLETGDLRKQNGLVWGRDKKGRYFGTNSLQDLIYQVLELRAKGDADGYASEREMGMIPSADRSTRVKPVVKTPDTTDRRRIGEPIAQPPREKEAAAPQGYRTLYGKLGSIAATRSTATQHARLAWMSRISRSPRRV
jgi:hypothetical protein